MLVNPLSSKMLRQTTSLFGSGLFITLLSAITVPIVTRSLGPINYSTYILYTNITNFILLFVHLGFFVTVGIMLAETTSIDEQRSLIGATLCISFTIGICYALLILLVSFATDAVFNVTIGRIMRLTIPFLVCYPFYLVYTQIGKGTNRIDSIVYAKSLPIILRACVIVLLWSIGMLTVTSMIFIEASIAIIPLLVLITVFKPSLMNLPANLKRIWIRNKEFGIHVYISMIFSQSTYELDGVMIPIFAAPEALGFYRLANVFAATMNDFSVALGTSQFTKYTHSKGISGKSLVFNYIVLALGALGTMLLGSRIIRFVAGEGFNIPFGLILPIAFLGFINGAFQPYNHFLNAKGKGKWMRNIGYIVSGVNIVGNLTLIPFFGAIGAAWASFLSKGTGYITNPHYYRRLTHNQCMAEYMKKN